MEKYTDKFSHIYEAVPEGKVFRISYDHTINNLRLIYRDINAFDEIRDAFSVKNDSAFFLERYGYKSDPKLYAINKFGFFSPGLIFEILQWIKTVYGGLHCVAVSEKCKSYISEYLTPLKDKLPNDFHIFNCADDTGKNKQLIDIRNEKLSNGLSEENIKECPFEYRYYQRDSIEALFKNGYGRGLIEVPTAGGKSFVIANFIWNIWKHINANVKTLILVPNTQLVAQFYSDLIDYGIPKNVIARFSGSLNSKEKKENDINSAKIIISNRQYVFKNEKLLPQIDALIADECLVGNTNILTLNGNKKIKDITTDDIVLSFNEQTKTYEYKPVINVHKNLYSSNSYNDLISITTDNNNEVLLTPNHKVYTLNRGYIRADQLTLNDELISY